MGATRPAALPGRVLALEAAALGLAALAQSAWFAAWPPVSAALPLAALGALLLARARALRGGRVPAPARWRIGRLHAETLACLALAVVYRFPAVLHPWGWVNRDGAYGAFVALHLLQGVRPAPPFTEGANYQGTLKGHLAAALALVSGSHDLSLLMLLASLVLFLVFLAASMSLARQLGGKRAALATGLYLALGPRFLTVFSLNCVGQYVDVLALGGVALVLVASVLQEDRQGALARGRYLAIGWLLGAAFWQQPVALAYVAAAAAALALRRKTWRDPWTLLVPAGLLLGVLPVLLWNARHGWASADILGRDPAELKAQADALPHLAQRTLSVSFPILAGLSPGHPWTDVPGVASVVAALIPAALLGFLLLRGREIARSLRAGAPSPALLPPLLTLACVLLFWAIASGRVYWRPRYLLPLAAAAAVHLGVVTAWTWARARAAAALGLAAVLVLNMAGTLPRLREGAGIAAYYEQVVRSLEEKGIRTGYADFSLSAPVTMFTAERIVLSPRLGPTPAYESDLHARRLERDGPDAYVLRPEDDVDGFAEALRALGVSFRLDRDPVPVFHGFSRRVPLEEVAGVRGGARQVDAREE